MQIHVQEVTLETRPHVEIEERLAQGKCLIGRGFGYNATSVLLVHWNMHQRKPDSVDEGYVTL